MSAVKRVAVVLNYPTLNDEGTAAKLRSVARNSKSVTRGSRRAAKTLENCNKSEA
jgi:hypothetical protein